MAIKTVDPNRAYDKNSFVSAMEDYGKLETIVREVENPNSNGKWEPEVRKTLGDLYQDTPAFYAGLGADQVIEDSRAAIKTPQKNLLAYTIKNWDILLGKADFDEKALLALIQRILPLVKTGNSSLDKIIDAVSELRKINEVEETAKQDPGIIADYVRGKISESKDKNRRESYAYSQLDLEYNRRCFVAYANAINARFESSVRNSKGKVDKARLLGLFKESYKRILADKGKDSKEAKAYQMIVAKSAYEKEK